MKWKIGLFLLFIILLGCSQDSNTITKVTAIKEVTSQYHYTIKNESKKSGENIYLNVETTNGNMMKIEIFNKLVRITSNNKKTFDKEELNYIEEINQLYE